MNSEFHTWWDAEEERLNTEVPYIAAEEAWGHQQEIIDRLTAKVEQMRGDLHRNFIK